MFGGTIRLIIRLWVNLLTIILYYCGFLYVYKTLLSLKALWPLNIMHYFLCSNSFAFFFYFFMSKNVCPNFNWILNDPLMAFNTKKYIVHSILENLKLYKSIHFVSLISYEFKIGQTNCEWEVIIIFHQGRMYGGKRGWTLLFFPNRKNKK